MLTDTIVQAVRDHLALVLAVGERILVLHADELGPVVLLRNVVKVEDVADPVALVGEILARTDAATVKKLYSVEDFASPLEFLTMVALLTGRLLKVRPSDLARRILALKYA